MNEDGQVYFDDEDKIPQADKDRYDLSGLIVTGEQLLKEGHEIDQAVIDDLWARIEALEKEQREQKEQPGEQETPSRSEKDAQDDNESSGRN